MVHAVLLHPLPYKDAERLVTPFNEGKDTLMGLGVADFQYAAWRDQAGLWDGISACTGRQFIITGNGDPEQLRADAVTPGFLRTLGTVPLIGRDFSSGDAEPRGGHGCRVAHCRGAAAIAFSLDDQSQDRVRHEAEAVEGILRLLRAGQATWVSSAALEIEIGRNPDADRRHGVAALLAFSNEVVVPQSADRAAFLQTLGFGAFDALHLASAEQGRVDVFLRTDDGLLRRAERYRNELRVRVQNPLSWYRELAP